MSCGGYTFDIVEVGQRIYRINSMGNMKKLHSNNNSNSMTYEIHIKGILDRKWTDWFGDFNIRLQPNGETVLTGQVADQSALHGVVSQILNLNLELISVTRIETEEEVQVN
jgi:hypothetical protein